MLRRALCGAIRVVTVAMRFRAGLFRALGTSLALSLALPLALSLAAPLGAQRLTAGPLTETGIGLDQLTGYANGERIGNRTGVMLFLRASLLGHLSLRATQGRLLIGDFSEGGVGLYAGSSLLDSFRAPATLGLQVGVLLMDQVQVVAKVGALTGYGYDVTPGIMTSGRVRVGPVAVETARVLAVAGDSEVRSAMARWYPRSGTSGLNLFARWELERGKFRGFGNDGPEDQRSLQLAVSIER